MPKQVVMGAIMQCSFGVSPMSLIVLPTNRTLVENRPAATIMDYQPGVNILGFGMCTSLANPAVAAATTAASGVLTPMPCLPVTTAPWLPGSPTVLIGNLPALNDTSTCICMLGGIISITYPGQLTNSIP
jgi:hypothetical protein